jgi:hypothetical protein
MRRVLTFALIVALPLCFTGCKTLGGKCGGCKDKAACACKKAEDKPACSCPDKENCTCKK